MMIAGKRARKRPLIRTAALNAVPIKNLSVNQDVTRRQRGQEGIRHDDPAAIPKMHSIESRHDASPSQFADSIPISASMKYLQQLAILQAAGVLTAEEVLTAQGRLLGS